MSSNLADLPLDLLADLHPPPSSGQDEFKFGRSTPLNHAIQRNVQYCVDGVSHQETISHMDIAPLSLILCR